MSWKMFQKNKVTHSDTINECIVDAIKRRDIEMVRHYAQESLKNCHSLIALQHLDINGVNPVEMACLYGFIDEVKLFLENGCSPNLPTTSGRLLHTILDCMKSQTILPLDGYFIIDFLYKKGCDFHLKDKNRKSTLLYAAELSDPKILQLILKDFGLVSLDEKDPFSGFTPLHMCALKGNLECVQLLLKHSTYEGLNTHDNFNHTALTLTLHKMIHDIRYLHLSHDHCHHNFEAMRDTLCFHQHNAIAILEALLIAGANPNFDNALSLAFTLIQLDESTCQSLVINDRLAEEDRPLSPYAGVVRLLVCCGAKPEEWQVFQWKRFFRTNRSILDLIEEVVQYCKSYETFIPPTLKNICRLTIRRELANSHKLQYVDLLPLPDLLKRYINLHFL